MRKESVMKSAGAILAELMEEKDPEKRKSLEAQFKDQSIRQLGENATVSFGEE